MYRLRDKKVVFGVKIMPEGMPNGIRCSTQSDLHVKGCGFMKFLEKPWENLSN
jgi:hypothetical protein